MTPIQWFAFVILPACLAAVAFVAVRLFERTHPVPAASPAAEPAGQPAKVDAGATGMSAALAHSNLGAALVLEAEQQGNGASQVAKLKEAREHFQKALDIYNRSTERTLAAAGEQDIAVEPVSERAR